MKTRFAILIALASAISVGSGLIAEASVRHNTWYVKPTNETTQDGRSWKTAFASLQDALAAASTDDEIWVASGTYSPDPSDPDKSFVLKDDVVVYGGFAGDETKLLQRDFHKNLTILSGDIGKGDRTKNTHTIVIGADRAVLDGFTISDAYGTDKPQLHILPADILKNDMVVGGGMRNFMTSPIVRNIVFKNNFSPKGGAVYNVHKPGADQASFINVDFIGNVAAIRGGAVSNDLGAMPLFINCRFLDNRSQDKGGALYDDFAASPIVLNSLFSGNEAVSAGAIGNDGGSSPLLVNVTIADNTATDGLGGGLYQGTGADNDPILVNSVVDDIYNWHENVVAEVGSTTPAGQAIPLVDFLPISSLKGQLQPAELAAAPDRGVGYQSGLDGAALMKNGLVQSLIALYAKEGGTIGYRGEYVRPSISRKPVSAAVIHVAPSSSSPVQDGLSWATALTDLQSAIELASVSKAAVWIKAGEYHPSQRTDRIAAFILYDDLKIYGGFAGTETELGERPEAGAQTTLSARTTGGDYRYPHVLYGADNVVLDGLTVRDGDARGFTYNGKGGGLLAYHAGKTFFPLRHREGQALVAQSEPVGFTMTIQNCRFEQNEALEGGAIYAFGKATLHVSHSTFADNRAVYGGAVLDREGVTATYSQTAFIDNQATQDGGAAYEDYGSHATFNEVEFQGDKARNRGGAIYLISRASQLGATTIVVERSTFSGNEARDGASAYNLDGGGLTIENSTYPSNSVFDPAVSKTP